MVARNGIEWPRREWAGSGLPREATMGTVEGVGERKERILSKEREVAGDDRWNPHQGHFDPFTVPSLMSG